MKQQKVMKTPPNMQQLWDELEDICRNMQLTLSKNFMKVVPVLSMKCVQHFTLGTELQ